MKMYSVYDKKGCLFSPPFSAPHNAAAVRMFVDLSGDSQSTINKFPDDFALYYLGDFNEEIGVFDGVSIPQHMHDAVEFMTRPDAA